MASAADGHQNSSSRGLRRLLHWEARKAPERSPLIPDPIPSSPPPAGRKKGFALAGFRGLGCASSSSSQAFAPAAAAVRSSADWQGKRSRRRRAKQRKKKESRSSAAADVWCAPGIAFVADVPVDCVVSHHQMSGRGRSDRERVQRERNWDTRWGGNQEHMSSFMDSPSTPDAPLFGSDLLPSGHLRQMRGYRRSPGLDEVRPCDTRRDGNLQNISSFMDSPSTPEALFGSDLLSPGHLRRLRGYRRSPGGLEELVMFQTRLLFGAMDVQDQYGEMRLDVDSMSYEELLELGDRIGHVSTGLREEEIFRCLSKTKLAFFNASPFSFSSEIERKCSICQEEYEVNDEMSRLECGHSYHLYCIRQWLLQKNACPVCKTAVTRS